MRKKITGTADRPRLVVFRSNRGDLRPAVDDDAGKTLASASWLASRQGAERHEVASRRREVGKLLAKKAKDAGIEQVVFDRGGYLFHGRVKALADAAREGGLEF